MCYLFTYHFYPQLSILVVLIPIFWCRNQIGMKIYLEKDWTVRKHQSWSFDGTLLAWSKCKTKKKCYIGLKLAWSKRKIEEKFYVPVQFAGSEYSSLGAKLISVEDRSIWRKVPLLEANWGVHNHLFMAWNPFFSKPLSFLYPLTPLPFPHP